MFCYMYHVQAKMLPEMFSSPRTDPFLANHAPDMTYLTSAAYLAAEVTTLRSTVHSPALDIVVSRFRPKEFEYS